MKKLFKNNSAFTLIELLVVMVIIGILVVAGLAGLNFAQRAARDTARVADTRSVLIYIQDYYRQYKIYPASADFSSTGQVITLKGLDGNAYGKGITVNTAGFTGVTNAACNAASADSWQIEYAQGNGGQTYDLFACQESGTKSQNLSTTPVE